MITEETVFLLNQCIGKENLDRLETDNNRLKSENKELRYELAKNLENLVKQVTRLQKCIAENGTLKKSFVITKQELYRKLDIDIGNVCKSFGVKKIAISSILPRKDQECQKRIDEANNYLKDLFTS